MSGRYIALLTGAVWVDSESVSQFQPITSAFSLLGE